MPEYYNNILCLTYNELMELGVTKCIYDKMLQRGKLKQARRACYGNSALVAYDSLPDRIKTDAISRFGNPYQDAQYSFFKQHCEPSIEARQHFAKYLVGGVKNLPFEVQELYANNVMVIKAIRSVVNNRKALIKALGNTGGNIWQQVSDVVNALRTVLNHDLPSNPRRLQDKVNQFNKDGYDTIISGKWLNKNASKVTDLQHEALLRQLFRKHNNFDNEQIKSIYNIVAENSGWNKISASTVERYREKWNILTVSGRRGNQEFETAINMIVKRKAPLLPLVYWTADGWDAELLYQKTEIDKKGNTRTTYHNRLTIVVVLDACQKYPLGYAIGTHETPELIKEAYRNAVNHTAELFGYKHMTHQLQSDHYSIKKLTPMYSAVAKVITPARVRNAKAKIIEPYFGYINKKYCQLMPNWSGFGVTSNKNKQPNSEYLNKIRHTFPDEMGCKMQLERIIEMERVAKRDKYIASYSELPEKDRLQMDDNQYLLHLCNETGYTNKLSAGGLVVTINGNKKDYDSYDVRFRQFSHVDWTIKYDPSDTTKILAVNDDGSLQFLLHEKYVQPMALYDQTELDRKQLKSVRDFNKSLKGVVMNTIVEDANVVADLFENPKLQDTLAKHLLVDSNGQHKDNKSAARLQSFGQKMLKKAVLKEEKTELNAWQKMQDDYIASKVNINDYL